MREDRLVLVGHLPARKGGPVNTVSSDPAAHHDNQISTPGILEALISIHDADVAAIDQRIGQVSVVEINGAVNRRDAHSVAVVADARHDALHDPPGMQDAFGDFIKLLIRLAETKDVRIRNRSSPQTGSHRIANHAADPGRRATIRIERRWMIVRLYLKADRGVLIEFNDPGIVGENRYAPFLRELLRGLENRVLQQIIKMHMLIVDGHINGAFQRLVHTVFAPGLGDGFQLDISRLSAEFLVVLLNRLHLNEIQEQVFFFRKSNQAIIVKIANRPIDGLQFIRFQVRAGWLDLVADQAIFNTIVCQQFFRNGVCFILGDLPQDDVFSSRSNIVGLDAHIGYSRHDGFRNGIGHAALEMDFDQRGPCQPGRRTAPADVNLLTNRIAQEPLCHLLGKFLVEIRVDKKDLGRLNCLYGLNPEFCNVLQHTLAVHVGKARLIKHLKAPLFHDMISLNESA